MAHGEGFAGQCTAGDNALEEGIFLHRGHQKTNCAADLGKLTGGILSVNVVNDAGGGFYVYTIIVFDFSCSR